MQTDFNDSDDATSIDALFLTEMSDFIRDCDDDFSRNDLAKLMIDECIKHGIDRGNRILCALEALGFNKAHAGATLSNNTGNKPKWDRWHRDASGIYSILSDTPAPVRPVPAGHIEVPRP